MDFQHVIKEPILTEKGMNARKENCYLFKVNALATKIDIKRAVEKSFKVKVLDVNTVSARGKKRLQKGKIGHTAGFKKAYVRLRKGQKIEELEI